MYCRVLEISDLFFLISEKWQYWTQASFLVAVLIYAKVTVTGPETQYGGHVLSTWPTLVWLLALRRISQALPGGIPDQRARSYPGMQGGPMTLQSLFLMLLCFLIIDQSSLEVKYKISANKMAWVTNYYKGDTKGIVQFSCCFLRYGTQRAVLVWRAEHLSGALAYTPPAASWRGEGRFYTYRYSGYAMGPSARRLAWAELHQFDLSTVHGIFRNWLKRV